jgi:subtilisin family serine protease
MREILHTTTLAAAIVAAFAVFATAAPARSADSVVFDVADSDAGAPDAPQTYIIRFVEPGLTRYGGGTRGIPATSVEATRARKLDAQAPAAQAYETYLVERRTEHIASIAQALGHSLAVSHHYAVTMNGVAATLTRDEAARVARVPGVASVRVSRELGLDTYRGPEFIGASALWNGSAAPGGVGSRGEGIVVGVVDTGANSTHPSFADDAACGFDAAHPKLLSAVDCGTTDGAGLCNGNNPEADPGNGHGVHTASTAVGNVVDASATPAPTIPPPHTFISGVAPCAQLRTYKVCPGSGCTDAAITAGVENAIADRVDVVNYSIGPICGNLPGDSPWSDGDEIWLDALGADIFVAASAGNTRPGCDDPGGRVSNNGPWVATVAASTHDENVSGFGTLSATGPGAPPAGARGIVMQPGSGLDVGQSMSGVPLRYDAANPIGCTINGGFPPGYFNGAVALIRRGNCAYEEKINNAAAAGAVLAAIYNNDDGIVFMNSGGASLPAYSMQRGEGEALIAFIDASAPAPVTVDFTPAARQGDVLAAFSLRGPDGLTSITKPDLTAPGVNIYAALDAAENNYGYLSGTSMSSPHVAGAAALLRAIHPGWSPSEVKSALMLTAANPGLEENLQTQWTPDDVGGGRVDLTRAALVGFVLDETHARYLAADPAHGGDPKTLNLPSLRNVDGCDAPAPCTWTRTLRDTLPAPSSWTVSVNAPAGVDVAVDPPSFAFAGTGAGADTIFRGSFDAAGTQTIAVTATTDATLAGAQFAEVVFHEASGAAPNEHMHVAVKGTAGGDGVGVVCHLGDCAFQVDTYTTSFIGVGCATYCSVLWLNRFTPDPADYPITITSISTIFSATPGWNAAGDHINIYIYQDTDSTPLDGAVPVGSYLGYAMPPPSDAFTTITLPTPIVVSGPGDVLIALTNPPPSVGTHPASADSGPYRGRSFVTAYDETGYPPELGGIGLVPTPTAIPGFIGNWLIRASGTNAIGQPITLGLPTEK